MGVKVSACLASRARWVCLRIGVVVFGDGVLALMVEGVVGHSRVQILMLTSQEGRGDTGRCLVTLDGVCRCRVFTLRRVITACIARLC